MTNDSLTKGKALLKTLILLSGNKKYSIGELSENVFKDTRTIERYIKEIKEVGFVVNCNNSLYSIDKNCSSYKDISDLLHFSEEENYILSKAIHAISDDNLMKTGLIKKLYAVYDFNRMPYAILENNHAENISMLTESIKNKLQVKLINYSSAHSNNVRNRNVEPFAFTENYTNLWCYDLDDDKNKLFKTTRIEKVVLETNIWQNESKHREGKLDIFRMTSFSPQDVKIELSLRAAKLLIEEYPLSEKYITEINENTFLLETPVSNFEGIGRFVTGLINEVKIIESQELKTYVKNKIQKSLTKL